MQCALVRPLVLADKPALAGALQDRLGVHATPVVDDLDVNRATRVKRAQLHAPSCRLTCGNALLGRLDAVVHGVAERVHERIGDAVDDDLVELGILARQHELDVLARLGGHVTHQPSHAAKRRP